LLGGIVGYGLVQDDFSQLHHLAVLGPMHGGVIRDVTVVGQLHHHAKFDRPARDALLQFVEKIICVLGSRGCLVERLIPGGGDDSIFSKPAYSFAVNKLISNDRKKSSAGET